MNTTEQMISKAVDATCETLKYGTPYDGIPPTEEEAWQLLKERICAALKPYIEDAYAAGKRAGIDEAGQKR